MPKKQTKGKQYVGYKRCGNHIVKLEILGKTNRSRNNINQKFAKLRTNKVKVLGITKLGNNLKYLKEKVESVQSDYNRAFAYSLGKTITEYRFDDNLNHVCSNGIHYYETEECAKFHGRTPQNYTGIWKEWNESGVLIVEHNYKNGYKHGACKGWSFSGILTSESNYRNGKLHGIQRDYDTDSGKLIEESTYKDGKPHGITKEWGYDDDSTKDSNYIDGKLHGTQKTWDADGVLIEDFNYWYGDLHGPQKEWTSEGILISEKNYKNGKQIDLQTVWNESGIKIHEELYDNFGKLVQVKQWYDNGDIKTEHAYGVNYVITVERFCDENGNVTKLTGPKLTADMLDSKIPLNLLKSFD